MKLFFFWDLDFEGWGDKLCVKLGYACSGLWLYLVNRTLFIDFDGSFAC